MLDGNALRGSEYNRGTGCLNRASPGLCGGRRAIGVPTAEIIIVIRRMKASDVDQVVAIHLLSFDGFFLSFLGPRFLKLYYSIICSVTESICYVYLDARDEIIGFIVGTSNPREYYSRLLKKHWVKFAFLSINSIIKKPTIVRRIARAILHPSNNPSGNDIVGLFSIAILPDLQGTGIGKKLVIAFLEEAKIRGCEKVFLTSDRDNNETVNSFYLKLGFYIERQYVTPEGRKMNEYCIKLKQVPESCR
jgi:ribosomal protein S18 acetylase RimI-like enzyme